jgi:hypothetical protein
MTTEGAGTVFEFTVAGPLGPLFRSAFAGERIAALDSCTVIRVRVPADRDLDLVDLLGYFDAAGLRVRDLFRVCRPDEGSDDARHEPGEGDRSVEPEPSVAVVGEGDGVRHESARRSTHSPRTMPPPDSATTNDLSGSNRATRAPASTATGPTPGGNT